MSMQYLGYICTEKAAQRAGFSQGLALNLMACGDTQVEEETGV